MAKQPKQRAKNLGDKDIETIVGILDGWDSKLTWDSLIEAIESRMRVQYTRQALNQHQRVKLAFQLAKERLGALPRSQERPRTRLNEAEAQALIERYKKLEAENVRLKVENERLLEQFVTWAYNASTRGLDMAFLCQPLPNLDRDQTKLGKKTK